MAYIALYSNHNYHLILYFYYIKFISINDSTSFRYIDINPIFMIKEGCGVNLI